MGSGRIGQSVAFFVLCIICCGMPFAQAQQRTITQYVHTAWGEKEGAPKSIWSIAQTVVGFLWIGASNGLNRFDGVNFEHYEPPSGPALPSGTVDTLLALPNGDLWIGFVHGGISRLRHGRVVNYTSPHNILGARVQSLAQERLRCGESRQGGTLRPAGNA
ncbi:MAG TPA: hypothetical protein VGI45_01555 [Terracidiphilus sp.]|jgi:ligand-binding sensor domain-containing protein